VLVVEDEPDIRDLVVLHLTREGFRCRSAGNGIEALREVRAARPDLVVLDLMLPEMDGLEVCRRLRAETATAGIPIIMLTAKADEVDRVVGLELGADDYVAKPFSPREVVARVRAVLRRTQGAATVAGGEELIRFRELEIDARTREVRVDDRRVELTPKEFDLLRFMASSPRTVFNRLQLLDELWDLAFRGDPSTVTVHIRRLREKIERDPANPVFLQTIWGVGYKLGRP